MGDLSQRSDLHSMRREQERERRRMRDRERRQSMTEEQREKHLARRRKNYQLRRQRIKRFDIGYQSAGPTGTASSSEVGERIEQAATSGALELGLHCKDIIHAGIDQVLQKINTEQPKPGGTESLTYDLAKLDRRLRLSHVKHFARSLKHPVCEFTGSSLQIVADLIVKRSPGATCKSTQGLRLNSIKRLARVPKNGLVDTTNKQQQRETEAQQHLLNGDTQLGTEVSNSERQTQRFTNEVKISCSHDGIIEK